MIRERHPDVAARVVAGLMHPGDAPNLGAAARAVDNLRCVGGFGPLSWHESVSHSKDGDVSMKQRSGWMKPIASFRSFRHSPSRNVPCYVLKVVQAVAWLSAIPSSPLTRIAPPSPLLPRASADVAST